MKKSWLLGILTLSFIILSFNNSKLTSMFYENDYVEISTVTYKNEKYSSVLLSRKDDRVKAKYFAAKDEYGNNVYSRFEKWKLKNPNTILLSSGTYYDGYSGSEKPVGLTIDNGELVNETLENDKMDALVIVYATGGIVATNLKDGDLAVGSNPNRKYNLRGNAWDKQEFMDWAKENDATVFQTHLLVYKNVLKVGSNSSQTQRERRFLAVGKDDEGNYKHIIVNCKNQTLTLYQGAKNALDYLNNFENITVTFLVNLDTGSQDVYQLFNKDGSINNNIKGTSDPKQAKNLLVYYYE
jgi:hypothetical protein